MPRFNKLTLMVESCKMAANHQGRFSRRFVSSKTYLKHGKRQMVAVIITELKFSSELNFGKRALTCMCSKFCDNCEVSKGLYMICVREI